MDIKETFNYVMLKSDIIALATSVDNRASVRNISYIFDNNKVYFTSFKGRPKNAEIEANENIAFTTMPLEDGKCVRVTEAKCKKSNILLEDMKDKFITRHPGFDEGFANAINMMELYEISFDKADVTIGFGQTKKIEL